MLFVGGTIVVQNIIVSLSCRGVQSRSTPGGSDGLQVDIAFLFLPAGFHTQVVPFVP